ncbi:DUF1127 domain-containing protein [Falsiroseomonas sp.]|jgi:uncharacterized protein YjiS (DUF1127 family)|uniref:DUF1127 domain-containing protein n=1 Tax=Falsiroseomonas sp. TaxID=2870721 RepID=UPI003F72D185
MSGFVITPGSLRHGARAARRKAAGGNTWLGWLGQAFRAVTTRRYLAEMDDHMLKDIGLTRMDAAQEANRAPWDFGPRSM